jgi:nicotinamidase-related amidase
VSDQADLAEDYERAGFGARLGFGERPAVIVVDVCEAYLDPTSPLYAAVEDVVEAVGRVVDAARLAAIPVIFTRVVYQPGGADGGIFYRKVPSLKIFEAGSPAGEFPDRVRPRDGDVVVLKQYASAFFGTSLAATLTAKAVDTTIITGLTTSGCVRATAVDAVQSGFIPIVVRDAVGDRDERPHEASLFDLDNKYADVVDIDEVLRFLSGRVP